VVGLPHPDFGEAVAAVVVPKRAAVLEETTLLNAVRPLIANYKVPKKIFVVQALPRNVMGKVQKNLLREQYADTFAAAKTPG
jgi:malonyl-CoA/methylmalonyl-CoA synthetase